MTPYYGESFLRILVLPAFKNSGALLVAPDCPGRGWSEGPSERAVLALLDHAVSRWSVDPDRIAVTGFSMGGIGTWFLAEKHPGRFAAAIPVAGRPTGVAEMRVPVYAIHGKRDEVIDWRPTARAVEQLRSRGRTAEIDLVDGPTHYQTARFTRPLARAARWLAEMWTDRSGTLEAAPR